MLDSFPDVNFNKYLFKLAVLCLVIGIFSCKSKGEPREILAIGDSNGASEHGWVKQLQTMMPRDSIYNVSIPGNTIGFDNLGREDLNTLKNLDTYLGNAIDKSGDLDYVLILLGTNDSKAVFKDRKQEIHKNLRKLITRIHDFDYKGNKAPEVILISPPPYGPDEILAAKYQGGNNRVIELVKSYEKIARELNCEFVNVYEELGNSFMKYSPDGVHLEAEGQRIIAKKIRKRLE